MRKKYKISIPLGAIASFIILIYMIMNSIWYEIGTNTRGLMVIGLILLFFFGHIDYEREDIND
jgi:hypothetical protein